MLQGGALGCCLNMPRDPCDIMQLWVTWIILMLCCEVELRFRTVSGSSEVKQHKAGGKCSQLLALQIGPKCDPQNPG